MTDKQLLKFALSFRKGILGKSDSRMMCFAICAPLEAMLQMHGVAAKLVESDLGHCNHFWLRLPDGRALDPTADQFNYFPGCDFPPVYLGAPNELHP